MVKETTRLFIYLSQTDVVYGQDYAINSHKLQCLLYILQAYHYEYHNEMYFKEDVFEAWSSGPIIPSVYKEYKPFGNSNLFLTDIPSCDNIDTVRVRSVLEVWNGMKQHSLSTLALALTRIGGVWYNVYTRSTRLPRTIPNELIRECVDSLYDNT